MHGAAALSSLDTALLMAPFAVLLILAMFGLDERFAREHLRSSRWHKFCEIDPDGRGRLSDPDGTCPPSRGFSQSMARRSRKSFCNVVPRRQPGGHIA